MMNWQNLMGKRSDPNFVQIAGLIPKTMATEFRIACLRNDLTIGDALEEAIAMWLESRQSPETTKGSRK